MNILKSGLNLIQRVQSDVKNTVDKVEHAVGTAANAVQQGVAKGEQKLGQFVDGFEDQVAQKANLLGGLFGGDKADVPHDGKLVGAGGQTFNPGTPLSQIPGVTPKNNPNPSETILYVNGIGDSKDKQARSLQDIADTTGAKLIGVHNATEGMAADVLQCVKDKLDKGTNPAVDTMVDTLYTELKAGRDVHIMAHSQGGLITSRALSHLENRLRLEDGMSKADAQKLMSKLHVETFGAAATRYPNGPEYVHYVNRGDPVPGAFGLGPIPDKWNPIADGGQGSKVRHFNEFHLNPIAAHGFESVYLKHRVPFDQARAE
jgi:hypothetical protein